MAGVDSQIGVELVCFFDEAIQKYVWNKWKLMVPVLSGGDIRTTSVV